MVAAGNDLNSDYNTRFDGFIYMFTENGEHLWKLASNELIRRLSVAREGSDSEANVRDLES